MSFDKLESEIAELLDNQSDKSFIVKTKITKDLHQVIQKLWENYKKPAKILDVRLEKGTINVTICPTDDPNSIYWAYQALKIVGLDYWQLINQ